MPLSFLQSPQAVTLEARRHAIRAYMPLIGAALHVEQIVLFVALGLPSWMWLLSVASIGLYAIAMILVRGGFPKLGMWVGYGEILAHAILFTALFGAASDYLFFLGPMAISAFLVFGREEHGHRIATVALALLCGVGLIIWSADHHPLAELSAAHLGLIARVNIIATLVAQIAEVAWFDWVSDRADRALGVERERTEGLLRNVFPLSIAQRLKQTPGTIAESCEQVAVLFADIVGFTPMAAKMTPINLVTLLDDVFTRFDALADTHKLEKIKTIGDAYLVVGGIPEAHADPVGAIAAMALAMRESIAQTAKETGQAIDIRIGIAVGPVVAGVIGRRRFAYDLWGDTVNTAARMESHGAPGEVHVTAAVAEAVRGRYACESRGVQHIKGKGDMETYWLRHLTPLK